MRTKLLALAAVLAVLGPASPMRLRSAEKAKEDKVVKDGTVVSLQYSLSGEDGKLIESNKGKDPLKYTHGSKQIVPGLEKELAGMKVGGEKRVKVKPEDAYGARQFESFSRGAQGTDPNRGFKSWSDPRRQRSARPGNSGAHSPDQRKDRRFGSESPDGRQNAPLRYQDFRHSTFGSD